MELKTKFNLGETIVAIQNHKCIEFTIKSVHITASTEKDGEVLGFITYCGTRTSGNETEVYANENQCFASKGDYINQL